MQELETKLLNSVQISIFAIIFLNVDNSINIGTKHFKCCMLILDIIMEETMSQIFILCPSSH